LRRLEQPCKELHGHEHDLRKRSVCHAICRCREGMAPDLPGQRAYGVIGGQVQALAQQRSGSRRADPRDAGQKLLVHTPHRAVADLLVDVVVDLGEQVFKRPYACLDVSADRLCLSSFQAI